MKHRLIFLLTILLLSIKSFALQTTIKVQVNHFTDEEVQANAEKCREMTWPKIEKEYGKEVMDGLKADIEALQK